MEDNKFSTHPSYGMMEIGRQICSGSVPLFGSSIGHHNLISLKIKHASVKRDLNKEWVHGEDTIVEVCMSYSQFTQAIMSLNTQGTPVTIVREGGKSIPLDRTKENTRDTFSREFQEIITQVLGNAAKAAKAAETFLSSSKPTTKAQREEVKNALYKIHQDITSNMKFVNDSFNKQMDQTVTEAKGEVEAFIENKVRSLGIEAMGTQLLGSVTLEPPQTTTDSSVVDMEQDV